MAKQYYVYIMTNKRNTVLYTGVTSDLKKRVYSHKAKLVEGFSKRYKINKLVYYEVFDDIQNAIETLQWEQADSLFSACPFHSFLWRMDGELPRSLSYDHDLRPRRQDAPEDLVENGSIYVFRPWVLRECKNRLGGKIGVYRMHVLDSFQVDQLSDWEVLEQLLAIRCPARESTDLASARMLVLDFDGVMTDNRCGYGCEG